MSKNRQPPPLPSTPAGDPDAVIEINAVTRSFGTVKAVDAVSLRVGQGQTVALLGPNGAGKSTMIALLLGLLTPDAGAVRLFGADPVVSTAAGRVGAMLQDGGLMRGVSIRELLRMLARQYPTPISVEQACRLAQLEGLEDRLVHRLSGGQTQRVRVAVALIGHPELLVLDEPTAAMDVEARRAFWADMRDQSDAGRTILFSTHYLEEADDYADRVIVMGRGRVLADGTPASIKASVGFRAIRFSTDEPAAAFTRLVGVTSALERAGRIELRSSDADATLRSLLASHPSVHEIEVGGVGLEDAFVALTETARAA
jgi:ABC-2 type transport system ATP-binding protein